MITLYQLESFCNIVEEGSFRGAAEKLFISQPSISQHIASLEKYFGTELFIRQGRKVKLTPEGRLLYASAKEITGKIDNLNRRFKDLKNLRYGELKIGCSAFTGNYILPEPLRIFRRNFPHINISVSSGGTEELTRSLERGDIELFVTGKDFNLAVKPCFAGKTIKTDELIFVTTKENHLANKTVTAKALEENPFIVFSNKNPMNSYLRDFLLRHQLSPSDIIEVDNLEIGKKLALQGLGILLTGRIAVKEELEEGNLCRIYQEEKEKLTWEIECMYHRDRGLSYAGWEMLKIMEALSGATRLDRQA